MNETNLTDTNTSAQSETVMNMTYSSYKVLSSKGIYTFVKAERDGKSFVLKALKEDQRDRLQLRNALKKEFKTCKNLSHIGIVRYNELVQTEQFGLCIEQEYVDGRNLHNYLLEHHTDDEKIAIINQIASALQYIHAQGVLHRNLNLQNIFITKQGDQAKIVDFNVLSFEQLKPTPEISRFIAPELKDETMAADNTADIYSLGTIMKAMGLTLAYSEVIKRACAFKRAERYTDISEFLADFNHEKSPISMLRINPGFVKIVIISIIILAIAGAIYALRGVIGTQISKLSSSSVFGNDEVPARVDTVKIEEEPQDSTAVEMPATGKLAFMNTMKPALYKDLDAIFEKYTDVKERNQHIKAYYKGLIQANDTLDNEQRAEVDRVFGDYVKQKKAALQ